MRAVGPLLEMLGLPIGRKANVGAYAPQHQRQHQRKARHDPELEAEQPARHHRTCSRRHRPCECTPTLDAELAPQIGDMRVDRAVEPVEVVVEGPVDYLLSGERAARLPHEHGENAEFGRRQRDRLAVDPGRMLFQVDGHVAVADLLRSALGRLPSRAAQHRPYSRGKLPGTERLDDVVVRSDVQTVEPVFLIDSGGQHHNRHRRVFPEASADVHSVHPRKHQVEHDQIRVGLPREREPFKAVRRLQYLVTVASEIQADQPASVGVVLDYEYCACHWSIAST